MNESDFLTSASEHFLTEPYPNEAILWGKVRQEDYISARLCERHEYERLSDIREEIEDFANLLKFFYQEGQKNKG